MYLFSTISVESRHLFCHLLTFSKSILCNEMYRFIQSRDEDPLGCSGYLHSEAAKPSAPVNPHLIGQITHVAAELFDWGTEATFHKS